MSKIILITGASSGLGKALAEQLQQKGHKVYGTSRRGGELQLPFPLLTMDVCRPESVQGCVRQLIEREGKIDVLINNAGIGIAGPLEQLQMDNVERVFDTNFYGVIRVIQTVLPYMRAAGHGKIINISSIGAAFGLPFRGVYCASKSAAELVTESLRMELKGYGVQLCSVRAGDMQTNINANRIKDFDPEDAAYRKSFQRVYQMIDEDVANGIPVAEAARQITAIVDKDKLQRSYLVGKPLQKLSVVAKQILPGSWFERIIMKYSNM